MSAVAERRMRHFASYNRTDGSIRGSVGATDHPGFEEETRRAAEERGEGVIEHAGNLDLLHDRVDLATGLLVDPVDRALHADLDAKWQSILRLFPALANPVPPAPVPKSPGGTQSFSVSAFWADFAKRAACGEWSLRAPCDDDAGLAGPFRGNGTCLAPVLPGGELQWVDPTLPAQDGDFVLVRLDALELQRIRERCQDKPGWMETYGEANPLATKLLKAFGGQYWLVTAGSMFELGRNRILGVVRKALIDGRPAYEVPNILPGAATDTYSVTDAGPINIALNAPATQILSQQVKYVEITTNGTYDFEISASFRFSATGSPGSFTMIAAPGVWIGTTLDAGVQGVEKTTNTIEPTSITGLISRPAGTYRVGILCNIFGDGANNFVAGFRDINLRVAVIKR